MYDLADQPSISLFFYRRSPDYSQNLIPLDAVSIIPLRGVCAAVAAYDSVQKTDHET
jgi:hypothetical protein